MSTENMTPEEMRVAIAEACGYKWFNQPWNKEQKVLALNQEQAHTVKPGDWVWRLTPDYLNDLNAMHEAEKTLTSDDRSLYYDHLMLEYPGIENESWPQEESEPWEITWFCFHEATPAQRAEAFLLTITTRKEARK